MYFPKGVGELKEAYKDGQSFKFNFFYGHHTKRLSEVDNSCFSQWHSCPGCVFTVDDESYVTAEHFMMAEKARLFNDKETLTKILNAPDPRTAKKLGRGVKGFNESVWNNNCFDIVVKGNLAKFSQRPKFKKFILSTGSDVLVEASPYDKIWGIGLSKSDKRALNPLEWLGMNLLGFALMSVRSK